MGGIIDWEESFFKMHWLSYKTALGPFGKMGWKSIFKRQKKKTSSQALAVLGIQNIAAAVYCFMEVNLSHSTYSHGAVEYLSNLCATIPLYFDEIFMIPKRKWIYLSIL